MLSKVAHCNVSISKVFAGIPPSARLENIHWMFSQCAECKGIRGLDCEADKPSMGREPTIWLSADALGTLPSVP